MEFPGAEIFLYKMRNIYRYLEFSSGKMVFGDFFHVNPTSGGSFLGENE